MGHTDADLNSRHKCFVFFNQIHFYLKSLMGVLKGKWREKLWVPGKFKTNFTLKEAKL